MTKLHLGCGRFYIEGYENIDFDFSNHTVQNDIIADRYCNVVKLSYPSSTVDEVRLHHVFEHFSRAVAMALLCRWCDWLRPGGVLRIETPDLMGAARAFVSPFTSHDVRQQIVRHLFGSHEASWAVHWDGWYGERFKRVLQRLDFKSIKILSQKWGALHNVEVTAFRGDRVFSFSEYRDIVSSVLSESLIKLAVRNTVGESEEAMLQVWLAEWEEVYLSRACDVS